MVYMNVVVMAFAMIIVLAGGAVAKDSYEFITKWGSEGSGDGQFSSPEAVAVDSSGNVYVADIWNHRIQKFSASGVFITKWGSKGTGDGQFLNPAGVAVDSSGNVYVADHLNHRIQKFSDSGVFITKWGSKGTGDGQFDHPFGIAVDSSGNVYVADNGNHRIQKFSDSGVFITKWGIEGTGDGQFLNPVGVAVDSSGNVYVIDHYIHSIQKFSASGVFITKWGSKGTGDGQFNGPYGVAVDSSGNVYVVDSLNNRIQKFSDSGVFITKWGSYGSGDSQFYYPHGVAVDSSGNVYVVDYGNNRIQKFRYLEAPLPTTPAPPAKSVSQLSNNASVSLTGEKTDVTLDEEIQLTLSAVNLITKPKMHVQVIIIPPSGMSVTSTEFSKSGTNQFTTNYELEPGDGKDIEVKIKPNQIGDFNVNGRIIYYFGDEKEKAEDHTLNLPIKVRKESGTSELTPTPTTKKVPGFEGSIAIFGLLFMALYIRKRF